ncbi:TRAP transporter large permease subunit, partial [Pseudomonas sp. SB113]|uniref:TRAP transporter large permease subunit n=1 Tax=Pseudomonas sp. SB113 TaxID=3154123 RepID=UPI00345CC3E2
GIGPGLLIATALLIMVQIWCRLKGYGKEDGANREPFLKVTFNAVWALMLPVIIIGGFYGGIFTPTEAAAIAAVYALVVGLFIYKELKLSDLPQIFRASAISTGAVMLIISAAGLFSFLISLSGIPAT